MDYSPPGSSVHGISQARILEWVAISFSRRSSWPRDRTQVSCIAGRFFTLWATTEAQEYWGGYLIPSPGKLPDPGIEPGSPALQVDSLSAEPQGKPKYTGRGSLFLLRWIFLTQELNQGLLHCRWILYQLSYQGSPDILNPFFTYDIIGNQYIYEYLTRVVWGLAIIYVKFEIIICSNLSLPNLLLHHFLSQ